MIAEINGRWQRAPETPVIESQQLHLWRFRVDLPTALLESLQKNLSADEIERAEKLRIAEKQRQFIVARGCLRTILARYLRAEPAALLFRYSRQGKPRLHSDSEDLQFNLSHSGCWGLLAIAAGSAVGVDIEQIDGQLDFKFLTQRYFKQDEREGLDSCSLARKRRSFYRLWTRKESALKLTGKGFALQSDSSAGNVASYHRSIPVAPGYLAAVCCAQQITSIRYYQLTEI